jgi:hypothetical protein
MSKEVDVVVVLVCNLAGKEESDAIWIKHCTTLLELTPGVTLGLYECKSAWMIDVDCKAGGGGEGGSVT